VTVEDPRHANFIDKAINYGLKYAYVAQTKKDWNRLIDVTKQHKWKCQVIDGSRAGNRKPRQEQDELDAKGVEGYLDDVLQYTDKVVKSALCDNANLASIGYTTRDVSAATDKLSTGPGGTGLKVLYTPEWVYDVKFSKYGAEASSVGTNRMGKESSGHFAAVDKGNVEKVCNTTVTPL
jgi:hypothetical protein